MPLKLDRLEPSRSYINPEGTPTPAWMILWQRVMNAIESAITDLSDAISRISTAETDIVGASDNLTDLNAAHYVTLATSSRLTQERVLTGGTGVAITDGGPGGAATIQIDAVTDLGFTPANRAGDTFTGPVDVQDAFRCDSLRIDATPSASTATITHTVPINLNGTVYYLLLSQTP